MGQNSSYYSKGMSQGKRYLRIGEVAKILGVSVRTVRRHLLSRLNVIRVGRNILIDESELEQVLHHGTVDIDDITGKISGDIEKMKLKKRENGIYYIYIGTTKYSLKTKDKSVAERLFREIKRNHTEKQVLKKFKQVKRESKKLSELIDEYLMVKRNNVEDATIRRYRQSLSNFLRIVGDKEISELTFRDIEYYKSERLNEVKKVSINSDLMHIRAFCNYIYNMKYKDEYIFKHVKLFRVEKRKSKLLTADEIREIFELIRTDIERVNREKSKKKVIKLKGVNENIDTPTIYEQLYCLFAIYIYAGRRRNEGLELKIQDIDFENGIMNYYNRKAKKYLSIPIVEPLNQILLKYVRKHKRFIENNEGQLFKMDPNTITHYLKRYFRKIGRDDLRVHDLRHNFASFLVKSNINLFLIKELLGHSDITTTMRYLHTSQDQLREALKKLPY